MENGREVCLFSFFVFGLHLKMRERLVSYASTLSSVFEPESDSLYVHTLLANKANSDSDKRLWALWIYSIYILKEGRALKEKTQTNQRTLSEYEVQD